MYNKAQHDDKDKARPVGGYYKILPRAKPRHPLLSLHRRPEYYKYYKTNLDLVFRFSTSSSYSRFMSPGTGRWDDDDDDYSYRHTPPQSPHIIHNDVVVGSGSMKPVIKIGAPIK